MKYKLFSQLWDEIDAREYRRVNQKWTIQRNWQHRIHKIQKKHTAIYVGHHYTQTTTNNAKSGGKDEQNIVFI